MSIKRLINQRYKSNKLQVYAFEKFTQMYSTKQMLQHVGGVIKTKKT